MKKNILILILLFVANLYSTQNTFLQEGNLSIAGGDVNLIQVIATQDDDYFISLIDINNDDIGDGFALINTSGGAGYIEIGTLDVILIDIQAVFPNASINKIYKRDGASDEYYVVGSYPSGIGIPTRYGFVFNFRYTQPATYARIASSTIGPTYNIADITDIFEIQNTDEYIVSGTIYDHIGINTYTSPTGGAPVTVNAKQNLAWVAKIDNALGLQKQYINYFLGSAAAPEEHLILDSVLNTEGNITAMGYVGTDRNLLMFELNITDVSMASNLNNISNYAPYTQTYTSLPTGTVINISKGSTHSGRYLEAGSTGVIQYHRVNATEPIPAPLAFPGSTTSTTQIYTLNATADVNINFDGYVAGVSQLWDFMDINCSDTVGVSRNISDTYVIPFPIASITNTDCLPPNVKYYESDKSIPVINLQWEWIFDKKSQLKWDRVHTDKTDTAFTSRMALNTNYLSKDNNDTTVSVLHNTITATTQMNVLQINARDGSTTADRKHPKIAKTTTITKGVSILNTQDGDLVITGEVVDNNATGTTPRTTDCIVIKIDKNGNEIWEQYLGHFQDDGCTDVVVSKSNRKPTYTEYLAVGYTKSVNGGTGDEQGWAVNFRDNGILIPLNYQWNLVGNPTDKNITALGSLDGSKDIPITNLGAHKYYFAFKNNQWLLNKLPIEPLDGFFLVSLDNKQDIFLEGNLLEQKFQEIQKGETGWVLLSTGIKLVNPRTIYDLHKIYVYRNGQYQSNPIEIEPGEGFWAKKER